ncbi:PepSY-associated TM helix domain-containing protein [Azomonas macrocytogenes]|uniref:Putative iron-regulated membrane protein n=1 Tax=Azomonas macrocytogenes TaxID=69962 RepID=A0A839T041_AZOMA|nr:PepSY-associated TM helix domain-containing protein [Azomonas macrocytogenes]MBB3102508.1 putative iron-regulated membrane protein [Azomonas macrocytogenes]
MPRVKSFTQSMAWLHSWAGLILGWLLFAIFLTGTLTIFDKEINWWSQPELRDQQVTQQEAARAAWNWLAREHGDAEVWNISLPTERAPVMSVSIGDNRRSGGKVLDPHSEALVPVRESAGGNFLYHFHYTLHMPRTFGIWVVGLAAMAMLTALVTGIVIHKRIFKDFFTFRPVKGRRAWLDGHNACAVLMLPFHLMITYTGLVIFVMIYMPAAVDALYDGNREAMFREARPLAEKGAEPRQGNERRDGGRQGNERGPRMVEQAPAAEMLPLESFIGKAESVFGPGMVASMTISHPGRANAVVSLRPLLGSRIALTKGVEVRFDAVSGKLLQAPLEPRASALTQQVMTGLHFAQFGGYPMRWLYFLCSGVSCAMIATGLVLFAMKQRLRTAEVNRGHTFLRVVDVLNIAVVAGLVLGCIGMLWANRLLPVELAGRAGWEESLFFGIWGVSLLHAGWRQPGAAWREQLGVAALLCLGLPLLGFLTQDAGAMDTTRLSLALVAVLIGLMLAWTAWRVGRPAATNGVPHEPTQHLAGAG